MESIVKNILEELYILEPNLRKQEKKLVNIIELMTKNIPKSEMNIEFKNKLRNITVWSSHIRWDQSIEFIYQRREYDIICTTYRAYEQWSIRDEYKNYSCMMMTGICKQWVYTHDGCMKNQNRWVSSNK